MTAPRNLLDEVKSLRGVTEVTTAIDETGFHKTDAESTAAALDNNDPNQCVKCKNPMSAARASGESVTYCVACRVTNPLPL
jgi:hypothetical protein